ncbi:hypothetical protein PGT21_034995 [Puccinia graminis f. sp. tritici]|uniref:Uncharacterized protein n=1 Tax=Puccinia graminis f. sp. tritici TaxID=56615 RepID=A0A5B0NV74_PUCGR|nr:hypothetical protein PGT21_034995 [Puccinia graminis f. sp. tritici]KAA1091980.1 hypothetical protein PGTUg99_005494 [Puccinia graminis f. sp. tritici]
MGADEQEVGRGRERQGLVGSGQQAGQEARNKKDPSSNHQPLSHILLPWVHHHHHQEEEEEDLELINQRPTP